MNILSKLLGFLPFKEGRARRAQAHNLYVSIVGDARNPATYETCNIADTVDGRFDMIVLHLSLVLKRLKDEGGEGFEKLSKELIGVYNDDMDRNLREMGVGDLSVGKHVKKMAKAFYGRLLAYDEALEDNDNNNDTGKMQQALGRNIYRGEGSAKDLKALLKYVASYRKHLNSVSADNLIEGLLPRAAKTKYKDMS